MFTIHKTERTFEQLSLKSVCQVIFLILYGEETDHFNCLFNKLKTTFGISSTQALY